MRRLVDRFALEEIADRWSDAFGDFVARFAGRFGRVEPRRRMVSYLRGLPGETERKNGWTLAGAVGDDGPQGMQRLLNHYRWDADALREDVRDAVVEHLGDPQRGILILDETGFLKKGVRSAGVAWQYSGRPGGSRIPRSGCSWPMDPRRAGR